MIPVGYTNNGTNILPIPPVGSLNWKPRASKQVSGPAAVKPTFYDTSTGTKAQVILAVSDLSTGFTPSPAATLTLQLVAKQQVSRPFQQYTYKRTVTVSTISGVEDGVSRKILRYSPQDEVQVYVNGVKFVNGILPGQYQLYDGTNTSPVPPNTILFNTPVSGTNTQFDIIVTQPVPVTRTTLSFTRMIADESRVGTGAWEGVDAVRNQVTETRYSLFYCDFTSSQLSLLNTALKVDTTQPSILTDGLVFSQVQLSQSFLLLSRTAAYTSVDRERTVVILLSDLTNTGYLQAQLTQGVGSLLVTKSAISDVFPVLEVLSYNEKQLVTTALGAGDVDGAEVLCATIVGPEP